MRIVHTADWHLCDRLGRLDRTDDLKQRVEAVAKVCEDHTADVLLIAGDLFSEQASVDDMTAALGHLRQTFLPFFARGGTILVVTGNHDSNRKIDMVRAGMSLAVPDAGKGGLLSTGRLYLANTQTVVRLVDPLVSLKKVNATKGKGARAEPVAALYEQRRVHHLRGLGKLEDQMCKMTRAGFAGKGSPDRVDALVWALTELILEPAGNVTAAPQMRSL